MMQDHADDCAVVDTGICTCTRGIGQPAAQVTRKRLIDEYQKGKEEGYLRGFAEGEEAAWAKMIALQNRASTTTGTVGFQDPDAEPFTQPITAIPMPVERPQLPAAWQEPTEGPGRPRHHRHRAEKRYLSEYAEQTGNAIHGQSTFKTDEFDLVPERKPEKDGINRWDIGFLLGLALGVLLIVGSVTMFFNVPRWPVISIGVAVAVFFIMLIKLDYDYREKRRQNVR